MDSKIKKAKKDSKKLSVGPKRNKFTKGSGVNSGIYLFQDVTAISKPSLRSNDTKKCYKCGKLGHIATQYKSVNPKQA